MNKSHPYCKKALQSFLWSWTLLCAPHRLIDESFKGAESAALSLSVVITTTAHYRHWDTIFSSSTLILTSAHSDSEPVWLKRSTFDLVLETLTWRPWDSCSCLGTRWPLFKIRGIPKKTASLLLLTSPFRFPNSSRCCLWQRGRNMTYRNQCDVYIAVRCHW